MVKKEYSYTSTPPMRRMAYTAPQCLYKGALYLFYMDSHSDVNKLQPEDTYRCWGMTLSIFVDELQSGIVRYEEMRRNVQIENMKV